jgi:hypothetical protein
MFSRRSLRQREKLEKEKVERIRAQNQQMLEQEKNMLKQKQVEAVDPAPAAAAAAVVVVGKTPEEAVNAYAPAVDEEEEDGSASLSSDAGREKSKTGAADVGGKVAPAQKKLRQTTLPFLPLNPSSPGLSGPSDSESDRRRLPQRERKPTRKGNESEEYLNTLANKTLDRQDLKQKKRGGGKTPRASGDDHGLQMIFPSEALSFITVVKINSLFTKTFKKNWSYIRYLTVESDNRYN